MKQASGNYRAGEPIPINYTVHGLLAGPHQSKEACMYPHREMSIESTILVSGEREESCQPPGAKEPGLSMFALA